MAKRTTTQTKYVAYNPTTGEYAGGRSGKTTTFSTALCKTLGQAEYLAAEEESWHYTGHTPTEGEWEVRKVTITIEDTHTYSDDGLMPWEQAQEEIRKREGKKTWEETEKLLERRIAKRNREIAAQAAERKAFNAKAAKRRERAEKARAKLSRSERRALGIR